MAIEAKEVVVYIRKFLLFSLKTTQGFACRHPVVASFVFFLLLLYRYCPSFFAFLVSSSPVLFCTAILLGTLLTYGEPNFPEIEEDDKINREAFSLKVENPVDDLFVKKDESSSIEGYVDSRVGADERDVKDSAPDDENERGGIYFATSSLVEGHHKIGVETIPEHWFVENREVLMKEQSEGQVRLSEVADGVSEGIEGLKVKTTTLKFDDWLDSSLGSPWQPINIIDAASDSESDSAESTSSDASMTDILPMLDELHPLLQSEASHALKSTDNSDVDLFQPLESDDDDDSVEQEHEHKIVEKEASNEVVMWTVDDQKNVMDLGSSDLERNRRLESLMARRRARKNQIIIFEKDLIDLHCTNTTVNELSRFHHQIAPISAPRRNPFEHPYDLEESTGLPPIPGSAPSVMLKRQNPFDFPCDREDDSKYLIGGRLSQPEFALPSQRGLFFTRYDSFSSHLSFPSDVIQEKHASSRLKCYSVEERVDSEGNELSDLHRQLSGTSNTKLFSASDSGAVSQAIDLEDQKELVEQEMQEGIALSISIQDTKAAEQDTKSYEDDLIEFEPSVGQDGRFVDTNTSAVFKETAINIDAYAIDKGEIEVIEFDSSLLDVLEHKLVEEKYNELKVFTPSEEIEKKCDIIPHEALKTIGQITSDSKEPNESKQSVETYVNSLISETWEFGNDRAVSVPIYDSSPSESGTFLANISAPNDSLPPGRECLHSTSSAEPEVQEDQMEVIPQARAPKENMASEKVEYEMVHSTSISEEPVMVSTSMNLLDENVLTTMGASDMQQNINKNKLPGLKEDFGDLATLLTIDHSSTSTYAKADLNDPGLEFCVGLPPSEVVEKHQSMEKLETQTSSGIGLDKSRVSNLELGPILEEDSEDIKVEEESASLVKATTTCCSTGLRMLQGHNVGLSSVGQELFSFHNESEEEDGDGGTAEGPTFMSEEVKPSENSNLVSPNDDVFTRLVTQELMDIIELSNPSKVKSESELAPNDVIKDSQDNTTNEFQINREVLLKNVNDFHLKPEDVHADVGEIEVMDELLLSELDVIGDFQVDEKKSKQCIHKVSQAAVQPDCILENSEFKSADFAEMSTDKSISSNLNNPEEAYSVLEQKNQTDTGYWSLSDARVENPEMSVYKSRLCVLEACSLDELDSVFKQGSLGEDTEPPCSKIISEKTEEEKSHVGLSGLDVASIELERISHDISQITLNGKAVENITSPLAEDGKDFDNSSFAHVDLVNDNRSAMDGCKADLSAFEACKDDHTEIQSVEIMSDHVEAVMPSYVSAMAEAEVSSTELNISSKDLEIMEIDSELLVLEAKSIEDIDSAFKHVAKVTVNKLHTPLPSSEPIITHTVDNILEVMPAEAEQSSSLLVLEAKSVENINSAFKQAAEGTLATPVFAFVHPESMGTPPVFEDMELSTVDAGNSYELLLPEARSAEGIHLAFKLASDGLSSMPNSHVVDPKSIKTNKDLEVVEVMPPETENDLLVPIAKFIEDIGSAAEQANDDHDRPRSLLDIEKIMTQTDLKLEKKSVDDITSSLQQSIEQTHHTKAVAIDFPVKPSSEGDLLMPTPLQSDLGDNPLKDESFWENTNSELLALEAESIEEINSSLKQAPEGVMDMLSSPVVDPEATEISGVPDMISLGVENNLDMLSLETTPLQHRNSASKQEIKEDLAKPTSQHDPESVSFYPDHDAMNADSKSDLFVDEEKGYEDTHMTIKEAAAHIFGQSSILLVDPEHMGNHAAQVVDVKSLDAGNNSDFSILEATSIEDLNLAFRRATEGFLAELTSKVDTESIETHPDQNAVEENSLEADNFSKFPVLEANSVDSLQSAFTDATAGVLERSSSLLVDPEEIEKHPGHEVEVNNSSDAENDSEMLVIEEKSLGNINAAFKQATDEPTSPLLVDSSSLDTEFASSLLVVEAKSVEHIDSALKQAREEGNNEVDPEEIENHPGHEVEDNNSSDAENDSEMLVIQAKSLDDINAAFKQATDEPTSPLLVDTSSLDTESASSSLVVEAKYVEHIDSALKHAHEEGNNESTSHSDPMQLQVNPDHELIEDSWLSILEERSVEDIDSGFKQVAEEYLDKPVTPQDDSKQAETLSEFIPEPNFVSDCNIVAEQVSKEGNKKATIQPEERSSPESTCQEMVRSSEAAIVVPTSERQPDAEEEYAKETVVAFDEAVADKNSSSVEQNNRRTDGGEVGSQDSSSSVPPILKIQKKKKKKSEKSVSSSSSSSSSSDSE